MTEKTRPLVLFVFLWLALFLCAVPVTAAPEVPAQELNVLFLGFEEQKLEMVSVYAIRLAEEVQSTAIFYPMEAALPGESLSLREYYREYGLAPLRKKIEDHLNLSLAYHVIIYNDIMAAVEEIIGPLTLAGETVNLGRIFTMPPGPQDSMLLGELVHRLTKPEVYFWHLPRLVLAARRYIATDFPITAENLWLHYRLASRIPAHQVQKVILSPPFYQNGCLSVW